MDRFLQIAVYLLESEGFRPAFFDSIDDFRGPDLQNIDINKVVAVCDYPIDVEEISQVLSCLPKGMSAILKVSTKSDFDGSRENLCRYLEFQTPNTVFRAFGPPVRENIPLWISCRPRQPIIYLFGGNSNVGKSSAARTLDKLDVVHGDDEIFKLELDKSIEYAELRAVALEGIQMPDIGQAIFALHRADLIGELAKYLIRNVTHKNNIAIDIFLYPEIFDICVSTFEGMGYRVYVVQHSRSMTLGDLKTIKERDQLTQERDQLRIKMDSLLLSRSWRFTKPLRSVVMFIRTMI